MICKHIPKHGCNPQKKNGAILLCGLGRAYGLSGGHATSPELQRPSIEASVMGDHRQQWCHQTGLSNNGNQHVSTSLCCIFGIKLYDIPYLILLFSFFFRVWRCLQNKFFSLNQPRTTNEIAQDTVDRTKNVHLTCMKPCKQWHIYHINWCRISSIMASQPTPP